MKQKEKVEYIITELNKLYPNPIAPLVYQDVFTLLISVLLSAQTTDKKVNEVTPALYKVAPNAFKMAELPEWEIKEYIKEIGLSNTKSKNIHKLSTILVEKYNGEVPESFEELEALPGVGHKTASVVMSQGFGHPAFPVDTHIHRLMKLWKLTNGKNVEQTEKDAKRLFPKELWNILHIQIIFYGREYSPARGWNLEKDFITKYLLEN
ncbi:MULTISPECIES: endonuclease III [Apibacter]|uniref:endonuclease III n=1 Tax=Apibacter TaxID=1778601 RepID=UPI001C69C5E7|nr:MULTISPECIES: endonuclease III [Apibacter]QYN49834.1 endonuclease III [Apibacter sp. ESL0432]